MKKIFKKRRSSRGVALLFALGILSLLLILGLAFVSNALLAQKAASNNSNRALAKMLAQSAISRVAIVLEVMLHAQPFPVDLSISMVTTPLIKIVFPGEHSAGTL